MSLHTLSATIPAVDSICQRVQAEEGGHHGILNDPEGAAMYSIVMITVFATAMVSFKQNQNDDWDREG